jgi:hypothetical protein
MTLARRFLLVTAVLALACALALAACSSPPSYIGGGEPDGGGLGPDALGPDGAARDAPPFDSGGEPYLTALRVTSKGDASPTLALVPSFSPGVHDYYVRCAAGTNDVLVSMTASKGSTSLLLEPLPSAALPKQTVSLGVLENQAIVAAARKGTTTIEYWVRCLPHDMPPLEWTPAADAAAPLPGYYLVGSIFPAASAPGYAIVLDGQGVPVWYAPSLVGYGASNVENVVPGAISFGPFSRPDVQPFEVRQLSPLVTTKAAPAGYPSNIHEFQALTDGHFLQISFPIRSDVDLTGLHVVLPDGGTQALGPDSTMEDCALVEFTPAGEVVWSWLGTDHFDAKEDSTYPTLADRNQTAPDGGELIDVFHCNSIDVDPENGNLLVSARNMDSIFYLDRATGRVLWKAGGKPYTKDGATLVSLKDPFFRQHDARLLPGWSASCRGGSGQISLFDDETGKTHPARAVVYDVVVGSEDAGCGDAGATGESRTASVHWQYEGARNSAASGSFRISPDGSRVIGWGLGGATNLTFTEVDEQGHELVSFGFDDGMTWSYRAIKVPLSAFDLETLRKTAGLP